MVIKKYISIFVFILIFSKAFTQIWPSSLIGRWTFDNTSDLLHATIGNDLSLIGKHYIVPGPADNDRAVAIDNRSYYICRHGMSVNDNSSLVNEYSIMFDVMVDNPNEYHCLYQTNKTNTDDGEIFINSHNQIGIGVIGYSGLSLKANEWYRIVISVDLDNSFRFYVDGILVFDGINQTIDRRYSLDSTILFFADNNREDNLIYVSQLALFNSPLSPAEVRNLSGFHYSHIAPYLQSPATNSICISWNSYDNASTIVQYGTTNSLGIIANGKYDDIGSIPTINRWHNVKVEELLPDTRYYYRCISGADTSEIFHFRTPPSAGIVNRHIRFLKFGDNQTYTIASTSIVDSSIILLKQLFGNNWHDSISFVMHTGDICGDGSELGSYMNEYFNPFSDLSAYIPCMVSIGNHEDENNYFYQFMNYDSLTGFNEKYYAFNLGNCQFIALNTNGLYNDSIQSDWLQSQLDSSETNPNIDFVFTYNHEPAHSEIWPLDNSLYVKNAIYPILARYPKMVMASHGHSHCYERGTIMSTHSGNFDFRAVICGGAGGMLDRWGSTSKQTDYAEIQKSIDNYCFMLVDVEMKAKKVIAKMYSLGNSNKLTNLEVMDTWHHFLNQPEPDKPLAISPTKVATDSPMLTASAFSGLDSLMSSQFQVVPVSGDFNNPLIDSIRDIENYYDNSGDPNYYPINLNNGIDLKTYSINTGILSIDQTYMWRMRYRDQNIRWSDWSDTLQFLVSNDEIYIQDNHEISIFPNPSTGIMTIITDENAIIEIININGLIIKTVNNTDKITNIDLENLSKGVYFVKAKSDKGIAIKKFIVT